MEERIIAAKAVPTESPFILISIFPSYETRGLLTLRSSLLSLCSLLLALCCSAQESLPVEQLYQIHCANCHGKNMEGAQSAPLIKDNWLYGRDRPRMLRNILYGIPNTDMIAWSTVLAEKDCAALLDYILDSQENPPTHYRPFPNVLETKDYTVAIEVLVEGGFDSAPWGIEFVDERRALITERREGLRWMIDGKLDPVAIKGIPVATHYGDSGMFDLALHPDYSENGWVYISYVHPLGDPDSREPAAATRVIRGRVVDHQWVDQEDVFRVSEELYIQPGRGPWGSRLLFAEDGILYFSVGDSSHLDKVQSLDKPQGKVFRLNPDGSIPADGPFDNEPKAIGGIYTIGNRNIQGLDQHPLTGEIWGTEHGPMGGDELNLLQSGKNYGWPVISHGRTYEGTPFPTGLEGMEQPVKHWTPSVGVCPLEFYTGNLFPKWKNQAFVGALAYEEIKRLEMEGNEVVAEEVIMKNFGRVRDLKTGPDGALYVVINNPHAVLRLTPKN